MGDIRQLRTIFPVGAPTYQREPIPIFYWLAACLIGAVTANVLADWWTNRGGQDAPAVVAAVTDGAPTVDAAQPTFTRSFSICGFGPRENCVVDGDTFWMDGTKIRIADIDTPEIHPSRCAYEEELGQRAKARLRQLLNAGAIALEGIERDRDRYGRKLRIVMRDGVSLGGVLVSEGLARVWDGRRHPWC